MNPQRYGGEQSKRNAEDYRQAMGMEWARQEGPADEAAKAEQAARSVMHPESYDADWRYYYGALAD